MDGILQYVTIQNSYNIGAVIVDKVNDWTEIGGFASELNNSPTDSCYNLGNIVIKDIIDTAKTYDMCYVGGFSGLMYMSENKDISNCYNLGNVDIVKGSCGGNEIGGFAGLISADKESATRIRNCYTAGKINASADENRTIGSFLGKVNDDRKAFEVKLENCYYLNDVGGILGEESTNATIINSDHKTEEEMKDSNFIQDLNTNNTETIWMKDLKNKNKGFPILHFQ